MDQLWAKKGHFGALMDQPRDTMSQLGVTMSYLGASMGKCEALIGQLRDLMSRSGLRFG